MSLNEHRAGTCNPDDCSWCQTGMPRKKTDDTSSNEQAHGGGKWSDLIKDSDDKSK